MMQCEVPHSERDFRLRDSIGGRNEDNTMSERLKSAGIFSGGVEALVFPQYLRPLFVFRGRSKSSEILETKPMPDLLASNVLNM